MTNTNSPNGKSKWLFGALGTIVVFVGLLVSYGSTRGSESLAVVRNTEDIATIQNTLGSMALDVAVTKTDVKWIKDKLNKENDSDSE